MNTNIIPIQQMNIDSQTVQTVNAREIHAFLEIGKDFTNWIKAQIKRSQLIENKDFIVFAQKGENGRPSSEYHLTIEAGKHVAMMSGVSKGREVRDYFIECERRSQSQTPSVKDARTQMMIEMLIKQDQIEQEQQRQSLEVARLQENIAVIEARTQPENKYFTVLGYANLIGKKIDYQSAAKIGRQCANISREQGLPISDVRDPRFGRVHSYHETALQTAFCK